MPYEWNDCTACSCQCFLFVTYSPASIDWTSSIKKSSCYPSLCLGRKKGRWWQRQGQGKVWPSPPKPKTLLLMAQTKGQARLPRLPDSPGQRTQDRSQRDKMSNIQSDPSHSSIPTPRSPTARPPSKANKFTANKPDRRSAKLTEAHQDTMFE